MSKTAKFFSLLLIVVFAALSADPGATEDQFLAEKQERYRLTVTEVDPEHHCFKLSNKLICNLLPKNWETDPLPAVGDEVFLKTIAAVYNRRWTIPEQGEVAVLMGGSDTVTAKQKIDVWISGESEYSLFFLGIVTSSDLIKQTSGLTKETSDSNKEILTLTDGSRWIKKHEKSLNNLSEGDRVIVSRFRGDEYRLISLDSSLSTQLKDGKTARVLAWLAVEPWDIEKATKE